MIIVKNLTLTFIQNEGAKIGLGIYNSKPYSYFTKRRS